MGRKSGTPADRLNAGCHPGIGHWCAFFTRFIRIEYPSLGFNKFSDSTEKQAKCHTFALAGFGRRV